MIKIFSPHFLALFIIFSSFQAMAIESNTPSEQPTSTTAFYSYKSDLSNPKPLKGATLEPRQTYFFITDNSQYKKVTFYCCKGLNGDAAGEPHAPVITYLTAPYRFSRNTTDMASGTRELYFDTFPTAGGVENHTVNFNLAADAISQNTPPIISGSPANRVNESGYYNFLPSASDADNDTLTFSISGKPHWAVFDSNNGRLSGTPPKGETGNYNNIIISVTDDIDTARLPVFNIQVEPVKSNEKPTSTTAFYSYKSDLSNPKPLKGATLEPRQTYFFITDNGQYRAVTFYCCKGLFGDAAGESHTPAIVDNTSPYRFSRNTTDMASGTRELYFDTFPTAGGVENHVVNFSVAGSTPTQTGSFTISWTAPRARADGSALTLSEIAGYTVHYGLSQGNYTSHIKVNNHSAVSKVVKNIPAGNYHVAISTRDTDGRESSYSNAIVVTVQ